MSEPTDSWPTRDDATGVIERETAVGAPAAPSATPAPPTPPPDRRVGAGMLLGLCAVLLVAAGILAAWVLTHRGNDATPVTTTVATATSRSGTATARVAVPRVVGLQEQKALVRLAAVGLHPKERYRSTSKPSGTVVSQKPSEAKDVRSGATVTIVVDGGAPKVTMPDVTGGSYAAARSTLDALGLTASSTRVTSTKPAGTVLDQAPKPGEKLHKGSNVTLSVAKAPPTSQPTTTAPVTTSSSETTTSAAPPPPTTATMPDLHGTTEAAAADALWSAGIFPSFVFIPADDPLGTVEEQATSSGDTVPYRSHVQVNLSRGPGSSDLRQVPNVVGQGLHEAVSTLNGTGLRLIYVKYPVSSRTKAGRIVQQTPLGGSKAPRNAQVLVFLAAYRG